MTDITQSRQVAATPDKVRGLPGHVTVGTNDLDAASVFYDKLLAGRVRDRTSPRPAQPSHLLRTSHARIRHHQAVRWPPCHRRQRWNDCFRSSVPFKGRRSPCNCIGGGWLGRRGSWSAWRERHGSLLRIFSRSRRQQASDLSFRSGPGLTFSALKRTGHLFLSSISRKDTASWQC